MTKILPTHSGESPAAGVRSALIDRIVIGGWCLLLLLGQILLPFECKPLEWMAIGWMGLGLLIVRPATCLPLLLLTCPVFQCEPHRAWAWAQPLLAAVLLIRILCDPPRQLRVLLWAAFWGVFVAWASWPVNTGELLIRLRDFPRHELIAQWLRPEATWAIFPFRATADRALAAALCAALLTHRRYLSTHRLWRALFAAGLLALIVTETVALVPWHQPHRFLGTTNYTSFGLYLLHGAGYNAAFLPMLLAAACAWFVVPLGHRYRWAHVGSLLLLPLLWFLVQRSLGLLAALLPLGGAVLLLHARLEPRHRNRLQHRFARFARDWRPITFVALASLVVSLAWLLAMGIKQADSPLRQKLSADLRGSNSRWLSPAPYGPAASPATPSGMGLGTIAPEVQSTNVTSIQVDRIDRLRQVLARIDPARAHMWSMGLRHVWSTGLWRGEGAGTWARFHRSQPRPTRLYFAHMHNTYLDLTFEYGLIPTLLAASLVLSGLLRLALGRARQPRIWLLYLAGMGIVALGQHLLFSFFSLCLLIPGVIVLTRAVCRPKQ